ncbi:hypothetical protein GCM10022289_04540 [Pedobacter jeongneungensis]|uniref:Uncharacterized protein n=1 Tax=Pedobacter jeongneungensis TaxID=947309 RepID=A0ABP8B3W3_9SPHI
MNKLMLNKGKAVACLILMCLFMAQACKKDLMMPNSNLLDKSISLEEAKQYFENNILKFKTGAKLSSNGSVKSGGDIDADISDNKLPMWDASQFKDLSIGTNAVLTPLHRPGVYIHISEKRMVKYGFLNYLMMHKDAENKIITEWVELKPSEKWINSKVSRKYDGKILVKEWNGRIKMLYNFDDGIPVKASPLKLNMLASVRGTKMDTGNEDVQCFVTTTTTIKLSPKTCPCLGHTYEQAAICNCSVKPEKGNQYTVNVVEEYDCELPFDPDRPVTGTGSSGTTGPGGSNGPGGGTPNPGDYFPLNCEPDPNYVMPTIPPPPGTEYILPCSAMEIPTEGTPSPNSGPSPVPVPKTPSELLIEWFNSDSNLQLHLTADETAFLEGNPLIAEELLNTTFSEAAETKEFTKWAVGYLNENRDVSFADFKRDFLTRDVGLDTSDLGTDGSGQDMNYSVYFDDTEGDFKVISKSDPNYNNVINNGTTSLPINFAPCTTQALRQMGRDKGWDVGVSPLEFNRRVGQAFQEATFKLYKEKLILPQRLRVKYQPQNNISTWRVGKVGNSGQVIPDWTYDVNFMGVSVPLSQYWFYDAKAVTGMLYLSSSKWQIGGYLDVLSRKKVPNAPPPALVFVTPVNTIISPSIIATAISKGVQIRQAFVIIINNKLYLLQSIELTPTNDKFTNIPTNLLKILSGPIDLEYPTNPNYGPDFEEVQ